MDTKQKLLSIREAMKKQNLAAVIIPSADPHMSEYLPEYWKTRAFASGFTGSAGTLVVMPEEAGLWTDGRYYVQAEKQMAGSYITLFRAADPGCPSFTDYLASALPENSIVGINGLIFSQEMIANMETAFKNKNITVKADVDVANEIWEGRPKLEFTEAFYLDTCYSGLTAAGKISSLRERLKESGADSIVISKLDSIAWLFNIRGYDIKNAPVVISYAAITPKEAVLFTEQSRIPDDVRKMLAENQVKLKSYEDIFPYITAVDSPLACSCDLKEINGTLYHCLEENPNISLICEESPVAFMKAVKNDTENSGTQEAYFKDGCALSEVYAELFEKLDKGEELPDEYEITLRLEHYRKQQPEFLENSFDPIVCYKSNAAMMHYSPQKGSCSKLEPEGMLLIDSGGHYRHGTTDITRTVALGPLTDEEKEDFTLSLKGFIILTNAVFKDGMTGKELDILCREPLWKKGLDYRCGTGHGVGFVLNIHEGPHGLGAANRANTYPLHENMVITIEPGVYREGSHGVRTENVVRIVKAFETEYGSFLKFKTFTLVPIDTTCIDQSLLTAEELSWVDNYNAQVLDSLKDHVSERAGKWLEKVCRPMTAHA